MSKFVLFKDNEVAKRLKVNGKLAHHDPFRILMDGRYMSFVLMVADTVDYTIELTGLEVSQLTGPISNEEAEKINPVFYNNYENERYKNFSTTLHYSMAELLRSYSKN